MMKECEHGQRLLPGGKRVKPQRAGQGSLGPGCINFSHQCRQAQRVTAGAIVFVGAQTTSYVQNLMYHRDAFTFATAELPLMKSSESCVRKTYDGISLRVWQDSDIRNDELLTRIDILYGFTVIRPDWACVIVGSAQ